MENIKEEEKELANHILNYTKFKFRNVEKDKSLRGAVVRAVVDAGMNRSEAIGFFDIMKYLMESSGDEIITKLERYYVENKEKNDEINDKDRKSYNKAFERYVFKHGLASVTQLATDLAKKIVETDMNEDEIQGFMDYFYDSMSKMINRGKFKILRDSYKREKEE